LQRNPASLALVDRVNVRLRGELAGEHGICITIVRQDYEILISIKKRPSSFSIDFAASVGDGFSALH